MSLQHAILGFLSLRSMTGYDLKKSFDRSASHFWPGNQSQIYRTLSKLTELDFVDVDVHERGDLLPTKTYSITPSGRQHLHTWLSTPLGERPVREPFLLQLFFGGLLSDDEVLALIQSEIALTEDALKQYEALKEPPTPPESKEDKRKVFFSLLTLEFGLHANETYLRWLTSIKERIEAQDYTAQWTKEPS
ncbi:MAG: hypothetical protein CL920_18280 [Deltaproteobacteria bacterium]|nr:hypothetical protein [Deltaproteobacteria bacterium]